MVGGAQLALSLDWLEALPVPPPAARRLRARPRRKAPDQLALSFGARRASSVSVGDRIGRQVVVSVDGELARVRCDCGAERSTVWRKLLQRGSTSCVRCAARSRGRGRSLPPTRWYLDPVCLRVLRERPEGASLEEVAEAYGVARESVRQIEAAAKYHLAERLGVTPARLGELLEGVRRRTALLRAR